jgi:uncharacterized membrane protein YccF (DUF307 family)
MRQSKTRIKTGQTGEEMSVSNTTTIEARRSPGCLLQILWFAFVGVWLGQAWMIAAWICMVTIIGIPLGVKMLNMLPKVIALREPDRQVQVTTFSNGYSTHRDLPERQVNFLLRAVYFVLVGWWFSALWMEAAFALAASIIGLPLAFWMFDRTPGIVSLHR